MKFAILLVSCRECEDQVRVFASLEPGARPRDAVPNTYSVAEAPDTWRCRCGRSSVPLTYVKRGIHDRLRWGNLSPDGGPLKFTPLYERGAIDRIFEAYSVLIAGEPAEEEVQKFLEANPLLWGFLSPLRIIHKPRVLTQKTADFGILTTSKILYLVEIEKPQTALVRKDDGVSAELQRGLDQIRDWRLVVGNHRGALLDELGFREGEVDDIRFILIAGLSQRTSQRGMSILRRNPFAEGQFYCFDELAAFLHRLGGELSSL